MRYNQAGINVDSIDKLILDIYNYAEKVTGTLNQISDLIEQTKTYCLCDEINDLRNKFESFKTNFPIINKNIISYADDFIKLKNRYQTVDERLTESVKKYINISINNINNKNNRINKGVPHE